MPNIAINGVKFINWLGIGSYRFSDCLICEEFNRKQFNNGFDFVY
jgi:hypothetical protein